MGEGSAGIAKPGRNCWRIEHAGRVKVIVDAADYYHIVHEVMLKAKARILLIGWDFDTRIYLERSEDGAGEESLGNFILDLAKSRPDLRIDILKWDFGALKSLFRGSHLLMLYRWWRTKRITFKFDSAHPKGCSHHQKIVVIDDSIAICGGIDMTGARWDTSEHLDDDPRRTLPNGKLYTPWHDITTLIDGDVATALAELGRERWELATKHPLDAVDEDDADELWPEGVEPDFTDVQLAIARTRAEYENLPEIREIEQLYVDMIAAAKKFIYIENQYFTAPEIAAAIARRMQEENPPEIVIIMPEQADGWIEQTAMDGARVRLCQAIGNIDTQNRFRIFYPVTKGGNAIYVHAKLMIVDDRMLHIGSSNLNNRSLGLDSECDVMLEAQEGDDNILEIGALRTQLMAEHLDVDPSEIADKFAETGSLLATIHAFQKPEGRSLRTLEIEEPDGLDKFIADNELLDPKSADGFFEPMSQRGLFKGFRRRIAEARGRRKGRANYWETDRNRFCYKRDDKEGGDDSASAAEADRLTQ